jgi:hypothetical protein
MWDTSVIFKKLPNVNNHPMGEYSPNLVTLSARDAFLKSFTPVAHVAPTWRQPTAPALESWTNQLPFHMCETD